jgi:hypothetical protein
MARSGAVGEGGGGLDGMMAGDGGSVDGGGGVGVRAFVVFRGTSLPPGTWILEMRRWWLGELTGSISAAGTARPSQSELLFEELDALDYSEVVESWKSKGKRVGRLGSGSLFMSFNRASPGDRHRGANPLVEQPRTLRGEQWGLCATSQPNL